MAQKNYSPLEWSCYFDKEDDINISGSNDSFHVYTAGTEGPLVVCLHGGGYCGLSFAFSARKIKEKARVLAMDLRGHGKSSSDDDLNLSIEIEWNVKGGSLRNIESARVSVPATLKYDESKNCYVHRAHLEETEIYWKDWYQGLSEKFLKCTVPKLLLLAGTDRLDRTLTIGQMQGKFQMVVVRNTGHAIQEDVPDEFATLILNFISRNRIGPNGIEIPRCGQLRGEVAGS